MIDETFMRAFAAPVPRIAGLTYIPQISPLWLSFAPENRENPPIPEKVTPLNAATT